MEQSSQKESMWYPLVMKEMNIEGKFPKGSK